jgi:aspartate racemase
MPDSAVVPRRLGLLGGMSWESTAIYYRLINRAVAARLGGVHSADLVLHSLDFAAIADLQHRGDWERAGEVVAEAARGLERAGARAIVMTSNTMHQVAAAIEAAVSVPLLHIVDATGRALRTAGVRRAGLLGTRYTMELPFWRDRMRERFEIEIGVPGAADRELVHRVIYEELIHGAGTQTSRASYGEVMRRLAATGAQAVILGCTEIGMLVSAADSPLPLYDTTELHAAAAVDWSLSAGGES